MKQTFLNHFTAMEAGFSPALLSPSHVEAVKQLCSLFPFDTSTDFGFETKLGNPEASCDFFLQIKKESLGASMLAGSNPIADVSPILKKDPFWKNLQALFSMWNTPSSLLAAHVELIWLEFDCGDSSYNTTPNIFFRITEETGISRFGQWQKMHRVLNEIYQLLFGIDFPADLALNLRNCIESLPGKSGLYQIGFMIPRQTEAIRLVLTMIEQREVPEYLKKIGWPGVPEVIGETIDMFSGMFDYFVYNVHIGKSVLPQFGIEMYFRDMRQPLWEPRWEEVFRFLESRNLALAPKYQGLIGYCGQRTVSGLFRVRYLKGINHLKIVYKPDEPLACKGYFGTIIREFTTDD